MNATTRNTANDKLAPVPAIGEGATQYHYSDNTAHTVVKVSKSGKTVWIQRDKATLLNGANSGADDALVFEPGGFAARVSGVQRYAYEADPDGALTKVTLREIKISTRSDFDYYATKDEVARGDYRIVQSWKVAGTSTKSRGGEVTFGKRSEHYDYNF